jgi:hypothetical protein
MPFGLKNSTDLSAAHGPFFELLDVNGLQINPAKCIFAATAIDFLGHRVTAEGIAPLRKHVAALQQLPVPGDVKSCNISWSLPGISGTLRPLTGALCGSPRRLEVTDTMRAAVAAAKEALASATLLAHPAPLATLSLATNASDSHIGAVLQQLDGRHWRPLEFFSQKLTAAQRIYSTFDRELSAVFSAVRHFRFVLEGRQFRILMDHKTLVAAFRRVSPLWSARQQWQLSYISEFISDIRHTPGSSNHVADALSRPFSSPPLLSSSRSSPSSPPFVDPSLPAPIFPSPPSVDVCSAASPVAQLSVAALAALLPPLACLDLPSLSAAQKVCPEVASMRSSPSLDIVYRLCGDSYIYGDISTPVFRPLLPPAFRRPVFDALHATGHPDRQATKRLLSSRFVWPCLAQQVTQWVPCQLAKTHRHAAPPAAAIPVPAQFTSSLWSALCALLSIRHSLLPAYPPPRQMD